MALLRVRTFPLGNRELETMYEAQGPKRGVETYRGLRWVKGTRQSPDEPVPEARGT